MIPRTRLLLWTALIVLPFAAIAGTLPVAFGLSVTVIGGLLVVVIFDAWLSRHSLAGIKVQGPETVRLQKDRPGEIELQIHNKSTIARTLRLGLAFPPEISSEADDRLTALPAGAALSRLGWSVTPAQRGRFVLEKIHLEAASPLGFWSRRSEQAIHVELRVYPNLFAERKQVAAVFLKRGQFGARVHRQAGQGREFEKLREYMPGDSHDEIHWKASAKRGHPVTKVFQIERTQEVYVIVDASRLSGRAVRVGDAGVATILERFVTAALVLGLAAEQQGDQFGLLTFSDRVQSFVRAKSGQAHFNACRDRLYTLQPQSVSPDFDELCSFIRLRLRKRALLIFLTALDDPMLAESFARSVSLICRQHVVLVNMLQPAGAAPLFSEEAVENVDDLYQKLGGHLRWRDLRELESVLRRLGVRFSLLQADRLPAQLIAQHADVKSRQLI